MKTKFPSKKWSLLNVSVTEIIFSIVIILFLIFTVFKNPRENIVLGEQLNQNFPIQLRIPSIGVDSAIEHVGLTLEGSMDVPKNIANSAWFENGTLPGKKGSAVIDGHSGWKDNIPAVFDNLDKIQKGDKIYVTDKKGLTNVFIVQEIRNYDPESDASKVFFSKDDKSHLNLITCGGVWDDIKKSHSQRLVVFSTLEPVQ